MSDTESGLLALLHAVNHAATCEAHSADGPGWEDACTCGLTRYRRVFEAMPDDHAALVEAVFLLAEDERFQRPTDAALAQFQKHAPVVESVALKRAWLKR